ncbi:MAG: DNA-binding protein WhiA [Eubacterium sp.]|nr:DNA-binding protein WhiA [Eubacterium sp.]
MSFSSEVKKELLAVEVKQRHCQLAELAALLSGSGEAVIQDGQMRVALMTENEQAAVRYARLLQQAGGIAAQVTHTKQKSAYRVELSDEEAVEKLFLMLRIIGSDGRMRKDLTLADGLLLQKSCCKRAFLRGAFLAGGSISNPKKSYHFEIVCCGQAKAEQVREQLGCFGLDARIVSRKKHEVVYLKEGSQIVDALNIMGAHTALMDLENVRIIKEMRNDINRIVNCETANINKTVHAAYRQQEAIRYLSRQGLLKELPRQLQEIAALRMEYPQATIQELGGYCCPPVGKSGVNHRLRRLEEAAQKAGYGKRDDQS